MDWGLIVTTTHEPPKQAARRLMAGYISKGYEAEALHVYTDIEGNPLHWRIRLKHKTLDKIIRPMRLNDDGTYELKEPSYPDGKPLYNLHRLNTDKDKPVFIVEGEKCADYLNKLGLLATTSGSADSVKSTDWQPLAGREVVDWRDYDNAGIKWQTDQITILHQLQCKIKCIDVEALNLPVKGDCVDWLGDFERVNGRKAEPSDIFNLPMIEGFIQAPTSDYLDAGEATIPTDKVDNPATQPIRTDDEVIAWLATLKPMDYDRVRNEQATALKVRPATLDNQVKQLKADNQQDDSIFTDIEPWHEPINPAQLLDDITSTIQRFIVLDKQQAQAAALWVSACWFIDAIDCAPIALINAPEKACGKSQLLSVFGFLTPRPLQASGISPSALYRVVEKYKPTLLIDEIETVLKDNDELRGLLNAGHTRNSAYVIRCVGDDHEPKRFTVWGMKAIAGINAIKLAETVTSRAIVFELRKKTKAESVQRLNHAEAGLFDILTAKLARFSEDYTHQVSTARPTLPDALGDRDQNNWEPLLKVASVTGSHWLQTANEIALTMAGLAQSTQSTSNELLADIQTIFERNKTIKISTAELIKALCEDTEAPWATYNRGKELTARQLSRQLATYGISSKTIRLNSYETAKGFEVEQFDDAFTRYLADPLNLPLQGNNSLEANNGELSPVTDIKSVTVTDTKEVTLEVNNGAACYGVTDKTPILGVSTYASMRDEIARF
jgi:putative DNA primase/helicase